MVSVEIEDLGIWSLLSREAGFISQEEKVLKIVSLNSSPLNKVQPGPPEG